MLISALCDYYDILAREEKVLPEGYSNVKVHYLVCLTEEGKIDDIIKWQDKEEMVTAKGKVKETWVPREVVMPQRTEKPGIDANIIEHRPLYLFGLNLVEEHLTPEDRTHKAQKSHEIFVSTNLSFLEGLSSPLIDAYRRFISEWNPVEETENDYLLGLGKAYSQSSFAFCLTGYPEKMLHEEKQIVEKWEMFRKDQMDGKREYISLCAVSGEKKPIARVHNKIKGVYGGLATGTVLIGFNNESENSYGREQSYNSNISESIMKKYTEALNYLLSSTKHKILLEDITVVYWAMSAEETCEDIVRAMIFGQSETMNARQTDDMLNHLMNDARRGKLVDRRLMSDEMIDKDVDFYIVGLKPNSSRLSVKFMYRKKYAEILWNIARHQNDLQISRELYPVSISRIQMELVSPKSKNSTVNPALMAKLFDSIINGNDYPISLLETLIRRAKTDTDKRMNKVRAGLIKACINRRARTVKKREELKVALDRENYNQAYLCGRLFAVLEKLQQDASNNSLNRTIKDSYFSSASSRPATVFPKLLKLAQTHLNKVKYPTFYNKLIQEIIVNMETQFPETLLLVEQGKFMVGYYQQYQSFFENHDKENKVMEVQ